MRRGEHHEGTVGWCVGRCVGQCVGRCGREQTATRDNFVDQIRSSNSHVYPAFELFFLFFFCPASLGDSQTRAFSWWARIQTSEKITVSTAQLLLGRSNYMYMMMDTLVDDVSMPRVDLRFHACRIQWRSYYFLALFSHIFMHRIIHKMAFGRNIMLTHVHTETKAGKYFRWEFRSLSHALSVETFRPTLLFRSYQVVQKQFTH